MAVKIPQNIEKEDKLVGPLTLRQFLYVLGGGSIVFVSYQAYGQGYLFAHEAIIISFLFGGLALALAFLNINGRPFLVFLGNLVSFISSAKSRLWQKDNTLRDRPTMVKEQETTNATDQPKEINRSELEKLATVLDTGGKMKSDTPLSDTHIINTMPETSPQAPEIMEENLGVEDIFKDTDV